MADNGVGSGIYQENAAGVLDLDLADDLRDGVKRYVCRGNAPNRAVAAFKHTGSAYYIGLAVFVKVSVPEHKRIGFYTILIPGFSQRVVVGTRHKGGVVERAVRQRHIQPGRIGIILTRRVADIIHHSGDFHVLVLDGVSLSLQHGQRTVNPCPGLLDRPVRGSLQ